MLDLFEALARELETSPNHRVLRRIQPRKVFSETKCPWPLVGIILDCETTGLDIHQAEVIELAMVKFEYTPDGIVLRILDEFSGLRQPEAPISREITRLTGIDNELVRGRAIDPIEVEAFVGGADLVIAHNARFDRPMVEKFWRVFTTLEWACSLDQIPWRESGYEGTRLAYLVAHHGWYYDAHRATDDCVALLHLLSTPFGAERRPTLTTLLANAREPTTRLYAQYAPFEAKDALKARGYRWSSGAGGSRRSWWRDLSAKDFEAEIEYLRDYIFGGFSVDLPTLRITALERYSSTLGE
jgi:DNA polymerase-3 subunit epsilon